MRALSPRGSLPILEHDRLAGWYGYSVFKKEMAKLAEQERPGNTSRYVIDELEQDPETGVYRPKK